MKSLPALLAFYGIFAVMMFETRGSEVAGVDKRYLAALAKNGRLPKFANAQKKDQSAESPRVEETNFLKDEPVEDYPKDSFVEDKRHVGAFLKSHGKPSFRSMRYDSAINDDHDDENREGKRNVATLARLGRLNAIRYGRFQPYDVGGKRMNSEEKSNNDEDNDISIMDDNDCFENSDTGDQDGAQQNRNWMQKKRYVAALARSGRLPIWHPQRMWWGGKRDDSSPYWSASRSEDGGKSENTIDDMAFVTPKNKRCKKVYEYQTEKRNVAALARNGKLPFRSNA